MILTPPLRWFTRTTRVTLPCPSNVFINVNQLYMAGFMTAPMVVSDIVIMAAMYQCGNLGIAIIVGSLLLLAACWIGSRQQAAVGDAQRLRSMIPHHAGALLMRDEAALSVPRIKRFCESIRHSRTREIAEMKALLQGAR